MNQLASITCPSRRLYSQVDWPYRSSTEETETGQGPAKESASVAMIRKYWPTSQYRSCQHQAIESYAFVDN
jgi:hypothetical protein